MRKPQKNQRNQSSQDTGTGADRPGDRQPPSLKDSLNAWVIGVLLLISGLAFFFVVRMFFTAVILALAVTSLFYPMHLWILRKTGNKRSLSALASCLIILLVMIVPLTAIGTAVAAQVVSVMEKTDADDITEIQKSGKNIIGKINNSVLGKWLESNGIDWKSRLREVVGAIASGVGSIITIVVNKTSAGIFGFVSTVGIMLFTLFYFFRDGREIALRIMYLLPLRVEHERKIIQRFSMTANATLKGTVVIGIIQGTLGAVTLLIFGIRGWVLWGVIMLILAVIPVVGPALVLVPIGILEIIGGRIVGGIIIIGIGTLIVSMVDNFIRPYLVGNRSKMHDLLVFFSTIGGLSIFGILGFIVGPIIAAMFNTVLFIYGSEFREPLLAEGMRPSKAVIDNLSAVGEKDEEKDDSHASDA